MGLKIVEMIEHVRTYGVATKIAKIPEQLLKQMFFGIIEKNNVFVFQPTDYAAQDIVHMTPDKRFEFSSPFDVISIECAGKDNYLAVAYDDDGSHKKQSLKICCVVYYDMADDIFAFYKIFDQDEKVVEQHVAYCSKVVDEPFKSEMTATLSVYINKLNTEKVGVEHVNEKVKIKTKEGNKFHKISQIIHVAASKKYFKSINEGDKRTIDYSHRFFRRGHWRKADPLALGKDRHGVRNQYGRTWVIESEVGDKSLPLIKKTRMVKEV